MIFFEFKWQKNTNFVRIFEFSSVEFCRNASFICNINEDNYPNCQSNMKCKRAVFIEQIFQLIYIKYIENGILGIWTAPRTLFIAYHVS